MPKLDAAELAARIDHTLLKPEATAAQVDVLVDEALELGFAAVCVNPIWVERCHERLMKSSKRGGNAPVVAAVAGFPLGAALPEVKAYEAQCAVERGAREVDMVINIAALIAGDYPAARSDVGAVVDAVKSVNASAIVKVILETRALSDEQIALGCKAAVDAKADFVKTSTGFHAAGGASVAHVALLKTAAAPLKVKASGGIRDLATALEMIEAGADRLGTSWGVAIVQEATRGA